MGGPACGAKGWPASPGAALPRREKPIGKSGREISAGQATSKSAAMSANAAPAARQSQKRQLRQALCLAAGYLLAEVIGGLLTNSLALLADAGHMLSDVAALGLSWFALWMAERPAGPQQTYGYYRTEILAALANGAALVAVAFLVFAEAVRRLRQPPEVWGLPMMAIAAGGLLVNLVSAWLLAPSRDQNLNVRGAWLHVVMDALGSLGALAAGAAVSLLAWNWVDPVVSILIGLLIIYSSWRLLKESVAVLMEIAPRAIDVDQVRKTILHSPGVRDVHDLHVWTITSGMDSLSAHVVIADGQPPEAILRRLRDSLRQQFGIAHVTLQLEPEGFEETEEPTVI